MRGNFKIYSNYSHYIPGFADCIILLLFLLVGVFAGSAVTIIFRHFIGAEATMYYGTLVSYPLMFIPAMIYASAKSRKIAWFGKEEARKIELDQNNFKPFGGLVCALAVIAATFGGSMILDYFTTLLPPMPKFLEEALKAMTGGPFWANFICVSLFAPFFEEWFFRGMVLRGLLGKGSRPWVAIAFSAFLFALIHANPWQAIPAFGMGLLLGYVYYKTGSLKLTMLMHFTNNTTSLILSQFDSLKEYDNWIDVLGPQTYWFCASAGILIVILSVRLFHKIEK